MFIINYLSSYIIIGRLLSPDALVPIIYTSGLRQRNTVRHETFPFRLLHRVVLNCVELL